MIFLVFWRFLQDSTKVPTIHGYRNGIGCLFRCDNQTLTVQVTSTIASSSLLHFSTNQTYLVDDAIYSVALPTYLCSFDCQKNQKHKSKQNQISYFYIHYTLQQNKNAKNGNILTTIPPVP
jgi:hypothetical protein